MLGLLLSSSAMKKFLTLMGCWLSLVPVCCLAAAPELSQGAQELINKRLSQKAYPSLVVGILDLNHSEEPAWFAYGNLAADTSTAPVRLPDQYTLYEIGSITKTFTSLLLAQELQQQRLQLTTPVQQLLDFPIGQQDKSAINLMQLATHSSGLPRLPSNFLPADPENPYLDYDRRLLAAYLASYQQQPRPDQAYSYSNFAYGLLGYALSQHHKTSYQDLLETRIFKPLGMTASSLNANSASNPKKARPHGANQALVKDWDFDVMAGAGAIRSSGQDMMRYLKQQVAPANNDLGLAIKLSQQALQNTGRGDEQIALGWHITQHQGQKIITHSGMTGGYSSYAAFMPDKKRAVYVVTNIARDVTDIGNLALVAAARYDDPEQRASIALSAQDLSAYLGTYALNPQTRISLTSKDQNLFAQLTGQAAYPVYAETKDLFFYKVADAKLRFIRDQEGKVSALELLQNGLTQRAPKILMQDLTANSEKILSPEILNQYVGNYEFTPAFKLQIRLQDQQLSAKATGQPAAPIYAKDQDHFFYKLVEAELKFNRDEQGLVKGLTLYQNGQKLPAKKVD